ncbi:hypothetical protein K457DRAFT_1896820 [Linnemannia elongata AG-77]|uniref:DDE Tnp4 domain-containing protein n=1 Tax=Linnemannia elongata AG-77 TaxID=1314771 RepID=A0A197KB73_9FUNG|nr:hypothetical protein K457DRAFT_1896820 [Linnemannia elongata AG-77]
MDALSLRIPKSSFHAIHTMFYKTHRKVHIKLISEALSTMFSNIHIRLSSAKIVNPSHFKHATLHFDGHDTRLSCEQKTSAEMYSFKLKKAGLMEGTHGASRNLWMRATTSARGTFAIPSFRSQMKAVFGDLGTLFAKHHNRQPILVTKVDTYNMQLQLCLLLLNIKKLIGLLDVETALIHSAWMRGGFDYPLKNGAMEQTLEYIPVAEMLDDM